MTVEPITPEIAREAELPRNRGGAVIIECRAQQRGLQCRPRPGRHHPRSESTAGHQRQPGDPRAAECRAGHAGVPPHLARQAASGSSSSPRGNRANRYGRPAAQPTCFRSRFLRKRWLFCYNVRMESVRTRGNHTGTRDQAALRVGRRSARGDSRAGATPLHGRRLQEDVLLDNDDEAAAPAALRAARPDRGRQEPADVQGSRAARRR